MFYVCFRNLHNMQSIPKQNPMRGVLILMNIHMDRRDHFYVLISGMHICKLFQNTIQWEESMNIHIYPPDQYSHSGRKWLVFRRWQDAAIVQWAFLKLHKGAHVLWLDPPQSTLNAPGFARRHRFWLAWKLRCPLFGFRQRPPGQYFGANRQTVDNLNFDDCTICRSSVYPVRGKQNASRMLGWIWT